MIVVPRVSTPVTAPQARDALLSAMPGLDRLSAALLLALVWVETGGGGLIGWNAGNISAGPSYPGEVWRPPWFEPVQTDPKLAALHQRMLDGTAPQAFRSYRSAPEGFADFAGVLARQFPTVLAAAKTGDARTFVAALHDSGYSKDYTAGHVPTFVSLADKFAPLVAELPAGAGGAGLVSGGAALAIALLAGGAWAIESHWKGKRR